MLKRRPVGNRPIVIELEAVLIFRGVVLWLIEEERDELSAESSADGGAKAGLTLSGKFRGTAATAGRPCSHFW